MSNEEATRESFWLTLLAPIGLGIAVGLMRLWFPGLSPNSGATSAVERFTAPVVSGVFVAGVLQIGRWWLHGRAGTSPEENLRTLVVVTSLITLLSAGLAAFLVPAGLALFLVLLLFTGLLWIWPRKPVRNRQETQLGVYIICVLWLLLSAAVVVMAFSDSARA